MSVRGAAVRVPIDASGNPSGPPQESPGFVRITLKAPQQGDLTNEQLADDGPLVLEPYMDIGDNRSESTINQFLGREQASSITQNDAGDMRQHSMGCRRAASIHGSEGSADGSSLKSNKGVNSEQLMEDRGCESASATSRVAAASAADISGSQPSGGSEGGSTTSADADVDVSLIVDLAQFPEFSSIITNTYWGQMTQNSTTLDIIAVYLKGQKILYIDSKTHCENTLNLLMMPTILISAICTVLSVALQSTNFGATLVACLTGCSTFILSIISFLKLDAKAQAHKTSAYQFDKLQTMCEFFSGKVLLIKDKDTEIHSKVQKFVNDVEKKVEEIKDTNQFIIPEGIRFRYPYIYSTNVFSQIKKMKTQEKALKNQLYFVVKDLDTTPMSNETRRTALITQRNHLLEDIVEHHNNLFLVDHNFNAEINKYGNTQRSKKCYSCWNWFKV
jgi:hypothetical protein